MFKQLLCMISVMTITVTSSWAGTCRTETLSQSTPTNQFVSLGETVVDNATKLSWMRCAVGQQWNGKRCNGESKMLDWQTAMALVDTLNAQGIAGHSDWRMPMVPELASIVERQCFNPRMNEKIFPDAPSELFWTSMEKIGTNNYAYTLDFGGGAAMATDKQKQGAVRLVRGGPWWQPPMMTQR